MQWDDAKSFFAKHGYVVQDVDVTTGRGMRILAGLREGEDEEFVSSYQLGCYVYDLGNGRYEVDIPFVSHRERTLLEHAVTDVMDHMKTGLARLAEGAGG